MNLCHGGETSSGGPPSAIDTVPVADVFRPPESWMVEPLDVTVTGADVVPSAAPATKVVGPHGVRVSVELVASRTRMVAVDVVVTVVPE